MITSNLARGGLPGRVSVMIGSTKGSGLLTDSIIITDSLATVHYSEIDRVIGTLGEMKEVDAALRATLDL